MTDRKATPHLKLVASKTKVLFKRYRSTGPKLVVVSSQKPKPTTNNEES